MIASFPSLETNDLSALTTFNAKLYDILYSASGAPFHVEFVNLCAFYSKVNETNVGVLKNLSDCMKTPTTTTGDAYATNTKINSLNWDKEDGALYRFMTSFVNL